MEWPGRKTGRWIAGVAMFPLLAGAAPLRTSYLTVDLAEGTPAFSALQVDSLGKGKFPGNPVVMRKDAAAEWKLEAKGKGRWVYSSASGGRTVTGWTVSVEGGEITLRSRHAPDVAAAGFDLLIDQKLNHATLLGRQEAGTNRIGLPCLLHLPDQGSLAVSGDGLPLVYEARRRQKSAPENSVHVVFPAATAEKPAVTYVLKTTVIAPDLPGIAENPRYDGYRRNFINIFQWHPQLRTLANNSSSDVCGFVLYQYAEVAARTPPLAPGLTAMDLIRASVDRVLDGGQVGYSKSTSFPEAAPWAGKYESLDHAPSILWAASRYALATGDGEWAKTHYSQLREITERMLGRDRDGDGLIEYEAPANSGSWPPKNVMRPANWWDTVGFGHKDAYSNAIAFQALRLMAELAGTVGEKEDATRFHEAAGKLKVAYARELYNPATGLIAGWKSADGQLHDYAFPFINGMAVTLGLVEGEQAQTVMKNLVAAFGTHGYRRFELGLPGNLIPIRKADYVDGPPRFGGGVKEDGSDGFQTYINGGATACHAYWTIKALYQTGMTAEARKIFYPMLASYEAGAFQGVDGNGKSRDWKNWRGEGNGYEGFLVDGYLALIAVEDDVGK